MKQFLQQSLIVVATYNQGKAKEFAAAFKPLGIEIKTLADYDNIPEIVEDGDSFAANARIKARIVGDALGVPALADDSGLCVDALEGQPGIYSARYAGEGATDADNNAKLLRELAAIHAAADIELQDQKLGKILSKASFVCALALYDPASGAFTEAEGSVSGHIISQPQGSGGFGYDPLFYIAELEQTMADLDVIEKQAISHRGAALEQLLELLEEQA